MESETWLFYSLDKLINMDRNDL